MIKTFAMNFELQQTISSDHPSLPGHFPDAPIVPGVVILDEVLAALATWHYGSRITKIHAVKFMAPLTPGQMFTITLCANQDAETLVDFSCRIEDRVIVKGRLEVSCAAS